MPARWMVDNRVTASGTILTPSSYQSALPAGFLLDQLVSKVWRSAEGYTVVAGVNDDLDFTFSGAKVATLDAGTYATPALYAAEVQTQLLAAGLTGATCTYDSGTGKFTLAASGAFGLPWSTGANAATSCGKDLGFDVSADDSSASSHVADNESYHSREWIVADLGSAMSGQALILRYHNVSASGVVRVQANASDAWGSPSVDQTLTAGTDVRVAFLSAAETYRYWRLLIEDVANDEAYSEAGVWFVGPYRETTVNYSSDFDLDPEDLSRVVAAIGGAHFVDEQDRRRAWGLEWDDVTGADQAILDGIGDDVPVGRCFHLALQPEADVTDCPYCFLTEQPQSTLNYGDYWNVSVAIAEAMP